MVSALFWQLLPVRVTISDMGPVLLSRLLGLTKVQEGVLNIVFRIANDRQMLLIDMKDLRSMLNYVSEHAKEYTTISATSRRSPWAPSCARSSPSSPTRRNPL